MTKNKRRKIWCAAKQIEKNRDWGSLPYSLVFIFYSNIVQNSEIPFGPNMSYNITLPFKSVHRYLSGLLANNGWKALLVSPSVNTQSSTLMRCIQINPLFSFSYVKCRSIINHNMHGFVMLIMCNINEAQSHCTKS